MYLVQVEVVSVPASGEVQSESLTHRSATVWQKYPPAEGEQYPPLPQSESTAQLPPTSQTFALLSVGELLTMGREARMDVLAWVAMALPAPAHAPSESAASDEPRWLLGAMLGLCLISALPCLAFAHLPMTDLPQHEAIVSIMRHMHDPAYGFEPYYEWALGRTLYVFPYFLALGLSFLVPLGWALRITVFVATLSYPLGVLLMLRALKKPVVLTLLALPLLYNRAFFWGFIHFNLGLGLAFIVLSELVGPWSRGKGWRVACLSLLTATTHVYGLVLLSLYALAWLMVGERRELWSRVAWLLPAAIALGVWGSLVAKAPGFGGVQWLPFRFRLREIGNSILGGYRDRSEDFILAAWLLVTLAVVWRSLPVTLGRWRRLGVHERATYILIIANLAGYFFLPLATATAKFINFRHLLMAAMLLPLAVSGRDYANGRTWAKVLPAALAAVALANAGWHLWRFDREADEFDAVLALLPQRPHIAQMTDDAGGKVMRSGPYMHFGAYGQAQRGGVLIDSFPLRFWNVPVKGRTISDVSTALTGITRPAKEPDPSEDQQSFDCFLVRQGDDQIGRWTAYRKHGFAAAMGTWQLDCQQRSALH